MTRLACMTLALSIGSAAAALAQQAPSAAPAAPATYKTNIELTAALKKSSETRPDMAAANVKSSDRYMVNMIRRGKAAGAIAHANGTELHQIVDGAGTLVTGGVIVRPASGAAGTAVIEGGETRRVVKGDVILIPENTPHWYKDVEGSITYLEVRFNIAPK